jgi:acetoin utilization protein AcuB
MSKAIPEIQKYMTTSPHSIGADQSIETAQMRMMELKIRHLPVVSGTKIDGILSDRDIKFALTLSGSDAKKLKVSDVAKDDVYVVAPNAKLDEVVSTMAQKKLGSALIVDNGKLVGIFTEVDVMRSLSELLHTRLTH